MLNKHELGRAIETAIERKIESGAIQSIADVARHFGVKAPSVHGWIKTGAISKDKLPELWRYFSDVAGPEHWGLTEWPAQLPAGSPPNDESGSRDSNVEPGPPVRGKVPLISQVSAGEWCEASDPFPPGVADDWIETTARVGSRAFALRVRGDSMTNPTGFPSFPDGVIVIVDPDCHPVHGSYVIAKIGLAGDAMFKRLSYDDGAVYLLPLNPKFDPVKVDDPRELHICGVVVKGEFDVMNGVSSSR